MPSDPTPTDPIERAKERTQAEIRAAILGPNAGDRPRFWWSPSQALIRGGSRDTVPADAVELVPRTAVEAEGSLTDDQLWQWRGSMIADLTGLDADWCAQALQDLAVEGYFGALADGLLKAGWRFGLSSPAPADDEAAQHVIEFRENGWTIMHPLSCRPALFDCPVNRVAEDQLDQRPDVLGQFVVELQDGELVVGEPADESTRTALAALRGKQT